MPTVKPLLVTSVMPAVLDISGVTSDDKGILTAVLSTSVFLTDSDVEVEVNITSMDPLYDSGRSNGNAVSFVASVFYRVAYNIYLTYRNESFTTEDIEDIIVTQFNSSITSGEFVEQLRIAFDNTYSHANDTEIVITGSEWGELLVLVQSTQEPTLVPSLDYITTAHDDGDDNHFMVRNAGAAAGLGVLACIILGVALYYFVRRKKMKSNARIGLMKYDDIDNDDLEANEKNDEQHESPPVHAAWREERVSAGGPLVGDSASCQEDKQQPPPLQGQTHQGVAAGSSAAASSLPCVRSAGAGRGVHSQEDPTGTERPPLATSGLGGGHRGYNDSDDGPIPPPKKAKRKKTTKEGSMVKKLNALKRVPAQLHPESRPCQEGEEARQLS